MRRDFGFHYHLQHLLRQCFLQASSLPPQPLSLKHFSRQLRSESVLHIRSTVGVCVGLSEGVGVGPAVGGAGTGMASGTSPPADPDPPLVSMTLIRSWRRSLRPEDVSGTTLSPAAREELEPLPLLLCD